MRHNRYPQRLGGPAGAQEPPSCWSEVVPPNTECRVQKNYFVHLQYIFTTFVQKSDDVFTRHSDQVHLASTFKSRVKFIEINIPDPPILSATS